MTVLRGEKAKSHFKGKSVALVGRAASILEHGDGAKIDSMDLVVRVNWLIPHEQDPLRVGNRTDIILPANNIYDKVCMTAVEEKFLVLKKESKYHKTWGKKHNFLISRAPTTGILALFMLQQAGASKVYMTGYDFYESGHSTKHYTKNHDNFDACWARNSANTVHSTEQDKRMFLLFYEQNKDWIELDNVLTQIVKNNKV
jgi:hypothetical protein